MKLKYDVTYRRSRQIKDYSELQGIDMVFEYRGEEYTVYRPLNGYSGVSEKEQHQREQEKIDAKLDNPKPTVVAVIGGQGKSQFQKAVSEFFSLIEEGDSEDGNSKA